jgi:NADH dehydrogenase
MHRVIILGGGFGGLYAARALGRAPVDVTFIDRRNFHLFQPRLYQVATGSLSPGEVCALRGIFSRQKNTRVLLGEAADIDLAACRISLRDSAVFEYDSLIVATGSQGFYYGNDQWREVAPSLKSVEEATTIRHKILYAFEAAERESDPAERRIWLTLVIIGAVWSWRARWGRSRVTLSSTISVRFVPRRPRFSSWMVHRAFCLPIPKTFRATLRPRSWDSACGCAI